MPPAASTKGALPQIKGQVPSPRKEAPSTNQVHSYHKLFWRVNMTVEFNIFHHADRRLYEIAAYNSEKDQEFTPLLLNEDVIKKLFMSSDAINEAVIKLKLKLSKDRFCQMPGPDQLLMMGQMSLFNNFIESHLNPNVDGTLTLVKLPGETIDVESAIVTPDPVDSVADEEEENEGQIEVKVSDMDMVEKDPKTEVKTVNKPAPAKAKSGRVLVQRKRSSIAEFNKSLGLLKKDSKSLQNANKMTENLLNLSEVSVDAFKSALKHSAGTSKFYDKSTKIGLFRWAVHRIVLQKYIERVKIRIDELNAGVKKRPVRINGTFPNPDSTDMQGSHAKLLSLHGRLTRDSMQSLGETLSREGTPRGSRQGTPSLPSRETTPSPLDKDQISPTPTRARPVLKKEDKQSVSLPAL